MTACGVFDRGIGTVSGAGAIDTALDVSRYAAVPATAPQLAGDPTGAAFVIQFMGEWPDAMTGESWIDHTCVFIAGDPVNYATGPRRSLGSGKILSGYYETDPPPAFSLPSLAP